MLEALFSSPLALVGVGYMIAKEVVGKPAGQAQGGSQGALQGQAAPATVAAPIGMRPEWAPGMPYKAPARRAPTGPVALDADIPEEVEKDVWKALGEQDETKARDFARRLAQGGYPVAGGIVAYHAELVERGKAALKSQEVMKEAQERAQAALRDIEHDKANGSSVAKGEAS